MILKSKFFAILAFLGLQIILIYSQLITHALNDDFARNYAIREFLLAEIFFTGLFVATFNRFFVYHQDDERVLKIRTKVYEIENMFLLIIMIASWLMDNRIILALGIIALLLIEIFSKWIIQYIAEIK